MLLAVSDLLTVSHLAQYKNGDVHRLKKRFEKVNNKSCLVQQVSGRELIFQAILCDSSYTEASFPKSSRTLDEKINQELNQEGKMPL